MAMSSLSTLSYGISTGACFVVYICLLVCLFLCLFVALPCSFHVSGQYIPVEVIASTIQQGSEHGPRKAAKL